MLAATPLRSSSSSSSSSLHHRSTLPSSSSSSSSAALARSGGGGGGGRRPASAGQHVLLTRDVANAAIAQSLAVAASAGIQSLALLNAFPADDPRWAEENRAESASAPAIILQQLVEKRALHGVFLEAVVPACQASLNTADRWTLCGHSEKIEAAIALREYQNAQTGATSEAVTALMQQTLARLNLQERSQVLGMGMQDLFYYELDHLDDILAALVEQEQADGFLSHLAVGQSEARQRLETVNIVNSMFEIILTSALKCREDLDEFFHLHEHLTTIPDPWTSSTKVRNALVRQYEVTTEAIGRTASVEQRALFLQQLAVLTDLLLTSYWGELEFLEFHGPEYEERHVAVFNTFVECRPRFIDPFVKHNDTAMAFALAEKYKHFQLLIQMCEDMDAPAQLDTYVRQFEPDGFAQELFQWYLDHGKAAKLLKSPRSRDAALGEFLKTHPELSWLHDIRTDNYAQAAMTLRDLAKNETALFQKRKTLLSLWKMALACADESNPEDSEDVWQFMWFMQVQELLVSDAKYAPLVAGFGNNGVNLETDYLEPLRLIDAFIGQYNPIPDAIDLALAMETYARSMPSRSDEENTSLLLDICVRSILKNDWSAVINASKQSPTDAELLQILNATAFFSLASLFDSQELLYSMNITLPDIVLLANDSRLGILRGNTELIRLLQTTAGMTSRSM